MAFPALDLRERMIYNLGNGRGFTVREVVESARRVTGRPIPVDEIVAKVNAVTVASARAAGQALLARQVAAIAALGPANGLESAAAIAESLGCRAA